MSVTGAVSECWIVAMVIREDGKRLLLGTGDYPFKGSQQHFIADKIISDTVDVQGGDGSYIVGQVRRATAQTFVGYIGDGGYSKTEIEVKRREFIAFFQANHTYEIIYVFPDGSAIRRQRGYIATAPEVKELYQIFPEYKVGLNFEDVNYYSYAEDEEGNEIYSQSAIIPLYGAVGGGLIWDKTGVVFNGTAATWDGGPNGVATLNVNSIVTVNPLWIVYGRAEYPQLYNATTGATIKYNGIVTSNQVLKIDMLRKTATLNGGNVLSKISGEWVSFAPGINRLRYDADNDYAPHSEIEWSEVVA